MIHNQGAADLFLPEILSRASTETGREISFRIPAELAFFEGHFPGNPILPGFVVLRWIAEFLRQDLALKVPIAAFRNVKFIAPLKPENVCRLTLQTTLESPQISFIVWRDKQKIATGRVYVDASSWKFKEGQSEDPLPHSEL